MENDDFNRWLAEVARLDTADDVEFNADNYQEVLLELGYEPGDLEHVQAAVEDQLTRARKFAEFGRWTEAVREYAGVMALAPWRTELFIEAARANLSAYAKVGQGRYAEAAEHWARRVIHLAPNDEAAYAILNDLDASKGTATNAPKGAHTARFAIIGAAILIFLVAVVFMMRSSDKVAPPPPQPTHVPADPIFPPRAPVIVSIPVEIPVSPPPAAVVKPAIPDGPIKVLQPTLPSATAQAEAGRYGLPLSVDPNGRISGIRVDATLNRLEISSYKNRHSARLKLRIFNDLSAPLTELKGTMEWLSGTGTLLGSKQVTILSTVRGAVRRGEQAVFGSSTTTVPEGTVSSRLVVNVSQRDRARTSWPPPKPICVKWEIPPPEGLKIHFRLRSEARTSFLWRYEIEAQNTGPTAVKELTAALTLYDKDETALGRTGATDVTGRKFVAATWQPPMRPGETRIMTSLPMVLKKDAGRFDHACVRVLSAE